MKNKRRLATVLGFVMVFTMIFSLKTPMNVNAGNVSHVKATAADVRTSANVAAGALKGVQGTNFSDEFGDTVSNLNMDAMFLNCDISWFVNTKGVGTKVYTMSDGTSYYVDDKTQGGMLMVIDYRIKQYREQGVTWNLCLMMGWTDINGNHDAGMEKLMYNPQPGHYYYTWNVTDTEANAALTAIVDYLTERYSYQDTFVQNWWINNEVNVLNDKIYTMDSLDANVVVDLAVKSYDLLYNSLMKNNPNALAYVSVTHDWNNTNEGKGVSTREFIHAFADAEKDKDWNLDLHAYPPQMHEQVWTKASSAYLRHDEDTVSICAVNLEVLLNYIKNNFGTNHRIIMSEQGFDSAYGMEEQAAMMAYTYYAATRNDMVDEVIFTTYNDTNSEGHDFYDMGIVDINGNKKPSYNVFKYMNTNEAAAYTNHYLQKLSGYTGRTISSWSDDILYQVPKTSDALVKGNLYLPGSEQTAGSIFIGMNTEPTKNQIDIEYRWAVYDYQTGVRTEVQGWKLNGEWLRWYPPYNGNFEMYCTARVAGNTDSQLEAHVTVGYNGIVSTDISSDYVYASSGSGGNSGNTDNSGNIDVSDTRTWPVSYQGYTFNRADDGTVTCVDGEGNRVINEFKCDGIYTYYFQADGTCMRDRLTYHPDGVHVIYFDKYGHEVFSDFAHVSKSISGEAVDDNCFFDVFGYMYVDVLTFDKKGEKLLYANPYGRLECAGWFVFSDTVKWADGTPCDGIAGGIGYGQIDCTLLTNTATYDWMNRPCYMQGNGVALY